MHERLLELANAIGLNDVGAGVAVGSRARRGEGEAIISTDPATGATLGELRGASAADVDAVIAAAHQRFLTFRDVPAPLRGTLIRRLGELLREHKAALGELVSLEVGKITSEGLGEVQEMIDICELAVGLSRQLHGLTIASERARHRMMEQWHPLGVVGVVTAFNFPVAVWAWNAALAAVCGDTVVWKPSPHAPLTALAVHALASRAMLDTDFDGVFSLIVGGADASRLFAEDRRMPLVSFTGSSSAGRQVASRVAHRLGRSLLELGGNNAVVVLDDADLDLATRAIVFGAVGTAGQRCTSTRRLFVQRGVAAKLEEKLVAAYRTARLGDPRDPSTLIGPVIGAHAVAGFERAIDLAKEQGGEVIVGGKKVDRAGFWVEPTIVRAPPQERFPIAHEETFAPILYLFTVDDLESAITANNAVSQGLSSALFTEGLRAAERFVSAGGSDCGIANVNLGTSGAEIGGAFGGEKDTGGGRESGSDAWKAYMRRQTNTINGGRDLPLAQGVTFL